MRNALINNMQNSRNGMKHSALGILYAMIFAVLCAAAPAMVQEKEAKGESQVESGQTGKAGIKDKWGVEITALRLTSSDHMIDFRYRVHDAKKAAPLFNKTIKPQLIHAATGKVLSVPVPAKVGALRTTEPPQAGRIYWMLFGNGGNLVKKGNEVSVVIGDFRADKLVVE